MKTFLITLFLAFYFLTCLHSQTIEGIWKTIDDKTGDAKSKVELTVKNNKLYGIIRSIYVKKNEDKNPLCTKCTGPNKNKRVLGMQIINGLGKSGKYYEGDDGILDPETGNYYDVKIWMEDKNTLKVRGYLGFIYRTQTWYKVN